MLYFVSLVCHSCEDRGREGYFNDTSKRPCIGKCGHTVCLECVNLDPEMKCPNCNVEKQFIDKTVNYGSWEMIKDYKKKPIDTFRKWWEGKEEGSGVCILCYSHTSALRLCVTCENSGNLKNFQKCVHQDPNDPKRFHFSIQSAIEFNNIPSRVMCSECFLEQHEDHKNVILKKLESFPQQVKYLTSDIAAKFLWNEMCSAFSTVIPCRLRYLRIMRTGEVLIHFARLHHPQTFPKYLSQLSTNPHFIQHFRKFSKVSKFFEGMEFQDMNNPELVEHLFKSLEFQWSNLKESTCQCQCSVVYDELISGCLGNEIESIYTEMVIRTDLTENMEDCLMQTFPALKRKVEDLKQRELPKFKTHLLPSVFCWNKCFGGMCQVFDDKDRSPVKCPRCENSICLECAKSNYLIDCPICGRNFQEICVFAPSQFPINVKVQNLLEFYMKHPIEVYEEWWNTLLPPGHGYCLVCSSFSTQLEICVYCELKEPKLCVFKRRSDFNFNDNLNNFKFEFKLGAKNHFHTRIQCEHCPNRLEAISEHKHCAKLDLDESRGMEMFRGCGHSRKRLHNECRAYDRNADLCEFSVIPLKNIEHSNVFLQFSSLDIAHGILENSMATQRFACKIQELQLKTTIKLLKSYTKGYFATRLEISKSHVNFLLKMLQIQWRTAQADGEKCQCEEIFQKFSVNSRDISQKFQKTILSETEDMEASGNCLKSMVLEDIDFSAIFENF